MPHGGGTVSTPATRRRKPGLPRKDISGIGKPKRPKFQRPQAFGPANPRKPQPGPVDRIGGTASVSSAGAGGGFFNPQPGTPGTPQTPPATPLPPQFSPPPLTPTNPAPQAPFPSSQQPGVPSTIDVNVPSSNTNPLAQDRNFDEFGRALDPGALTPTRQGPGQEALRGIDAIFGNSIPAVAPAVTNMTNPAARFDAVSGNAQNALNNVLGGQGTFQSGNNVFQDIGQSTLLNGQPQGPQFTGGPQLQGSGVGDPNFQGPQSGIPGFEDIVGLAGDVNGPAPVARENLREERFNGSELGGDAFRSAFEGNQGIIGGGGLDLGQFNRSQQLIDNDVFGRAARAGANIAGARGFNSSGIVGGHDVFNQLGSAALQRSGARQGALLDATKFDAGQRAEAIGRQTTLGSAASGALTDTQGLNLASGQGINRNLVTERGQDIGQQQFGQGQFGQNLNALSNLAGTVGGVNVDTFRAGADLGLGQGGLRNEADRNRIAGFDADTARGLGAAGLDNERFRNTLSGAADFSRIEQGGQIEEGAQNLDAAALGQKILEGGANSQQYMNELEVRARQGDQDAKAQLFMFTSGQAFTDQQRRRNVTGDIIGGVIGAGGAIGGAFAGRGGG